MNPDGIYAVQILCFYFRLEAGKRLVLFFEFLIFGLVLFSFGGEFFDLCPEFVKLRGAVFEYFFAASATSQSCDQSTGQNYNLCSHRANLSIHVIVCFSAGRYYNVTG